MVDARPATSSLDSPLIRSSFAGQPAVVSDLHEQRNRDLVSPVRVMSDTTSVGVADDRSRGQRHPSRDQHSIGQLQLARGTQHGDQL